MAEAGRGLGSGSPSTGPFLYRAQETDSDVPMWYQ